MNEKNNIVNIADHRKAEATPGERPQQPELPKIDLLNLPEAVATRVDELDKRLDELMAALEQTVSEYGSLHEGVDIGVPIEAFAHMGHAFAQLTERDLPKEEIESHNMLQEVMKQSVIATIDHIKQTSKIVPYAHDIYMTLFSVAIAHSRQFRIISAYEMEAELSDNNS